MGFKLSDFLKHVPLLASDVPSSFGTHRINIRIANTGRFLAALLLACVLCGSAAFAASARTVSSLAGTWALVAADVQHPDGSRESDYGAHPKGLLLIDKRGNIRYEGYGEFHLNDGSYRTWDHRIQELLAE